MDGIVGKLIRTHAVTCLDGKVRMKRYKGFDCKNFVFHDVPFIFSECKASQRADGYQKDCDYMKNPFECPYHDIVN